MLTTCVSVATVMVWVRAQSVGALRRLLGHTLHSVSASNSSRPSTMGAWGNRHITESALF